MKTHYCVTAYSDRRLRKPFLGLERAHTLVAQAFVVLEQCHECLGLLPNVDALVLVVV